MIKFVFSYKIQNCFFLLFCVLTVALGKKTKKQKDWSSSVWLKSFVWNFSFVLYCLSFKKILVIKKIKAKLRDWYVTLIYWCIVRLPRLHFLRCPFLDRLQLLGRMLSMNQLRQHFHKTTQVVCNPKMNVKNFNSKKLTQTKINSLCTRCVLQDWTVRMYGGVTWTLAQCHVIWDHLMVT